MSIILLRVLLNDQLLEIELLYLHIKRNDPLKQISSGTKNLGCINAQIYNAIFVHICYYNDISIILTALVKRTLKKKMYISF